LRGCIGDVEHVPCSIDHYLGYGVIPSLPLKPDPNVKYALDLGLEKYIDIVKPLDNDGVQDSNERQFVELMANSKKALDVPTFINYLKEKASNGIITDEELKHSNNFASLVNRLYDEIHSLKHLYENNPN